VVPLYLDPDFWPMAAWPNATVRRRVHRNLRKHQRYKAKHDKISTTPAIRFIYDGDRAIDDARRLAGRGSVESAGRRRHISSNRFMLFFRTLDHRGTLTWFRLYGTIACPGNESDTSSKTVPNGEDGNGND
jgi:hypothetical protein